MKGCLYFLGTSFCCTVDVVFKFSWFLACFDMLNITYGCIGGVICMSPCLEPAINPYSLLFLAFSSTFEMFVSVCAIVTVAISRVFDIPSSSIASLRDEISKILQGAILGTLFFCTILSPVLVSEAIFGGWSMETYWLAYNGCGAWQIIFSGFHLNVVAQFHLLIGILSHYRQAV